MKSPKYKLGQKLVLKKECPYFPELPVGTTFYVEQIDECETLNGFSSKWKSEVYYYSEDSHEIMKGDGLEEEYVKLAKLTKLEKML